jgi:hypothetical protein
MTTAWNADGECRIHGLTANERGACECCEIGLPAPKAEPLTGIALAWARGTTSRMAPGGDLYKPASWERYREGLSGARQAELRARGI